MLRKYLFIPYSFYILHLVGKNLFIVDDKATGRVTYRGVLKT